MKKRMESDLLLKIISVGHRNRQSLNRSFLRKQTSIHPHY